MAARYFVRGPRSELPRAIGRVEIHFPGGRCYAGGITGRHEWFQVSATSLDQGLHSDLQKIVAGHLAKQTSVCDQGGSYRPSSFKFCLSLARLSVRFAASVDWRTAERLGANPFDRRANFPYRFGIGRCVLRLRSTRVASADLDETNAAAALPARAWHRSFAQQRPRRAGSDLQPPV